MINKNKMDSKKIKNIKEFIVSAEKSIVSAKRILRELMEDEGIKCDDIKVDTSGLNSYKEEDMKIIEWIFTWDEMIGADGNKYPIPANYSSKSKLVQWDKLKLTIDPTGRMTYKQIEPIEREMKIGLIAKEGLKFQAIIDGKSYNLLTAAVTHYKANIGDKITVILPKWKEATFAAVETIVPSDV